MKKFIALLTVVVCFCASITAFAINTSISAYEYYKQQLNSDEKIIYQAIFNALKQDNFERFEVQGLSLVQSRDDLTEKFLALNNNYGNNNEKVYALFDEDEKFADCVQNALDAFVLDHPEFYWFDVATTTYGVGIGISGTQQRIVFKFSYTVDLGKENYNYQSDYASVLQKISSITSKNASRYEQVKAIHDYICQITTYKETTAAHDASGVFVGGKAVCQGYATAFKMACDYYSIPCVCASGKGEGVNGSEDHMWNYVQMENGVWYAVDVTWDDQNKTIYSYFLCGSENAGANGQKIFFDDHEEEYKLTSQSTNTLVYPQISKNAYFIGNNETPVPTKAPVATPIVTPKTTPTPTAPPQNNNGGEQNSEQGDEKLPEISIDISNGGNNQNNENLDVPQNTAEPTATSEVGGADGPDKTDKKPNLTPVIIGVCALGVIIAAVAIVVRKKK